MVKKFRKLEMGPSIFVRDCNIIVDSILITGQGHDDKWVSNQGQDALDETQEWQSTTQAIRSKRATTCHIVSERASSNLGLDFELGLRECDYCSTSLGIIAAQNVRMRESAASEREHVCVCVGARLCKDDSLHLSLSNSPPMETPIHVWCLSFLRYCMYECAMIQTHNLDRNSIR